MRNPLSCLVRRNDVADFFYPRHCVLTGRPLSKTGPYRYLDEQEASRILKVVEPHCPTCGHPFWGAAEVDQVCPHCLDLKPVFRCGKTMALMQGPARELILELKYRRGLYLLPDLMQLARSVEGYLPFLKDSVMVPVPLHPRRRMKRGFNQSLVLARELAGIAPCRVGNYLRRTRNTRTQTRLKRVDRQENVQNAFAIKRGVSLDPRQRYLLFDDVFTTGSTLNACARVLMDNGAKTVDIATLCHG